MTDALVSARSGLRLPKIGTGRSFRFRPALFTKLER